MVPHRLRRVRGLAGYQHAAAVTAAAADVAVWAAVTNRSAAAARTQTCCYYCSVDGGGVVVAASVEGFAAARPVCTVVVYGRTVVLSRTFTVGRGSGVHETGRGTSPAVLRRAACAVVSVSTLSSLVYGHNSQPHWIPVMDHWSR